MRTIAVGTIGALALLLCGVTGAQTQRVSVDIKAQPVRAALRLFGEQTGLQVSFRTEEIAKDIEAAGVRGELSAKEALEQLLSRTGLRYEFVNERTVRISSAGTPIAAAWTDLRLVKEEKRADDAKGENTAADKPDSGAGSGEMVVTGSHIRGVRNSTVPLTVFDRGYIERSGFSNTMQLIESLPMHFKGGSAGASEQGMFGDAAESGRNLNRGTGVNLRGLGTVSTLTLINGRRVAPSGDGLFVDVSTIPITAIERIEVVTDGASAIYGADAIAGVVNIILRQDFTGAETSIRYGSVTSGGMNEQRVSQVFGKAWGSGDGMLVAEYYKRDPLQTQDRDYVIDAGAAPGTFLYPERKLLSTMLTVNQDLPGAFDVMTNLTFATEDVFSQATNLGNVNVTSAYPENTRWSGTVGLGYEAFSDWRFGLEGIYSQGEVQSEVAVINRITGLQVQGFEDIDNDSKTWTAKLRADGTLFNLPAGPARLAAGMSYRDDDILTRRVQVFYTAGAPTFYLPQIRADGARNVRSMFGELYLPLVGPDRLTLSLSARHDEYSDFGSSTNPRIGLMWSPAENLELRASYSTSFRVPTVLETALAAGSQFVFTWEFTAPNGVGSVPIIMLSGSAPLRPEESENLGAGFTWRPAGVEGLSVTFNYFDIDYQDRITSPPFDDGALTRRSEFGELITDFSSDAQALAFVNARVALGDSFLDQTAPFDTLPAAVQGVRYLYDWRQQNAARTQTSGFDLTTAYAFSRGRDAYDVSLNLTHIREMLTSLTANSTQFDDVDSFQRPLDWRMRGMGTWMRGGLSSTLALNYSDNYTNTSLFVDQPVGSWTTVDLNLSYAFGEASRSALLNGSKLSLSVINLLDEAPPQLVDPLSALGFDVTNATAMDRFITVQYSKRW